MGRCKSMTNPECGPQDRARHRRGNPWRVKFPPYWLPGNPSPDRVGLMAHGS